MVVFVVQTKYKFISIHINLEKALLVCALEYKNKSQPMSDDKGLSYEDIIWSHGSK